MLHVAPLVFGALPNIRFLNHRCDVTYFLFLSLGRTDFLLGTLCPYYKPKDNHTDFAALVCYLLSSP